MASRFSAAIARAARPMTSTPSSPKIKRATSPSSSELSSPPPSSDEDESSSKYFRRSEPATVKKPMRKRPRLASPPSLKPSPTEIKAEPPKAMGDVPSLLSATSKGGKGGKKSHPTTPPPNWEEMYELVKAMRLSNPAPVDTMGCERLADPGTPAKTQRFHTLIALMLSSQTKDTVTSAAMQKLRTELPGGLTLESILAVEPAELDRLIAAVGFHRRKTEYIKRTAVILRDDWDGDIPDSLEGLVALPGVGPKMAHLCMSAAWDKTMGIGVDVHVHRICNLWGWVNSTTPEGTREQLEAWLPKDKWREINWLLVGFGQTICLPRGRKCGECKLSNGLCRAAYMGDAAKGARKGRGKVEVEKEEEEDEWKPEGETSGKRRPKRISVKIKEEDEDLEAVSGEKNGDFKLENGGTPRSRRLRKPVKTECKKEDEWMPDIEDVVGA